MREEENGNTAHYGDYRQHPGIKNVRMILLVLLGFEMVKFE